MSTDKFVNSFEFLTGHKPYPWQIRLFDTLVAAEIPHNLSLPTGTGKTNSIVCWLLALIFSGGKLPRRLVYVVDRRSVVDQSTKVVQEMYTKIEAEPTVGTAHPIHEVRSFLSGLAHREALLGISTLRGEFQDNEEWSRFPFRPSVIVGTVDMVGSRLLFSGYGDGPYSRSLHAGLLGNDVLMIFDECHLVPAFAQLLQNVEKAGGKFKPFHALLMSATGNGDSDISLEDDDLADETISKRLHAKKSLNIVPLTHAIDKQIAALAAENPPMRTMVFVRSPKDVVKISSALRKKFKNVVTLTGTMRGKERDDLILNPIFQSFTIEQEPTRSATEVGWSRPAGHGNR